MEPVTCTQCHKLKDNSPDEVTKRNDGYVCFHVCPHYDVSLVFVARSTKATQNSRRKSLHTKTTLICDARPVTLAKPAARLFANTIWNRINLSANGAIYLHLAQSVGSCSLGTCTILLNNTKAKLWIASCDVEGAWYAQSASGTNHSLILQAQKAGVMVVAIAWRSSMSVGSVRNL